MRASESDPLTVEAGNGELSHVDAEGETYEKAPKQSPKR